MKLKYFIIAALILVSLVYFFIPSATQAVIYYPFYGEILAFIPSIPFVCSLPSIIVGGVTTMPVWGMLPVNPLDIYGYYNVETPGTQVMGIAIPTVQACFQILMIGTTPGPPL